MRKPLIIGAIIAAVLILTAAIWTIINADTSSNAHDIPEAKLPDTSHMGVIELEVAGLYHSAILYPNEAALAATMM